MDEGWLFPDPPRTDEGTRDAGRKAPSPARADEPAAAPKPAARRDPAPEPVPDPDPDPVPDRGPETLTVSELTRRVRGAVSGIGRVRVEGEVTQLTRARSGHLYFSLKEGGDVLACVIWKSRVARAVPFALEEGMSVVCHGPLEVYGPRGTYSLQADRVEQRGLGELLVRLEALKRELEGQGWFARARPLPRLPRTIGVVASKDSAAFQDFLRTRSLRWPGYPLRLAHTSVQGPGSAAEIAASIRALDASGVDVIVVIRGGGSLEDLWSFNERVVAEAAWSARVPLVTGVGHQTDTTLIDLVADLRAHTPTDAAQSVIPERAAHEAELERWGGYLTEAADRALARRDERLERLARARVLRDAGWIVTDRTAALARAARGLATAGRAHTADAARRLTHATAVLERARPERLLERARARGERAAERLTRAARERLAQLERRLATAEASLRATSPLAVLERGYSITRRAGDMRPLTDAADLAPGERVETVLFRGGLVATVEATRPADAEGASDPGPERGPGPPGPRGDTPGATDRAAT